jgi:hypothetical protein
MTIRETQQKLEQWGQWLRGGVGLGYGANVIGSMRGGGLPSAPISDDHALQVDRVVAVLKQTNIEQYECIKLCYVSRMSYRAIGREVELGVKTVQRRIEAGEYWLDAAFEMENI